MSKLYCFVYIRDTVNDAANTEVTGEDVVFATSHKEAQHMFFKDSGYDTLWDELHEDDERLGLTTEFYMKNYGRIVNPNRIKFKDLIGDEKQKAIDYLFEGGTIFKIEINEIEGIDKLKNLLN